ncbi:Glutamine-binding periplasmic protein precursor [Moraxella lacunata]|uniref:Glutamine-binding periplasmic protein n=2 Tax=Moraxella lacunata TaxID=477 RepID=A0A378QHK6_MORLA|nr:Glutamine-binding periplasmic protein precursor [Moraxella lacunata]
MGRDLNTGKHDIVAAGVVVTPEREELYAFTDTYMDTGWMLVLKDQTADGKPNYSNFSEAVKGSTVFTTEYGAAGQDELEAIVQSHGNARMMDSSTPYLEISNVIQGRADAAYDNSRVMQYYIFKNSTDPKTKTYGIMDPNAQTSYFAFAVKKGNDELLNQLNEGLREMKANGKYDELRAKWFGE